jgi:hemerythrin superfamily protein
MASLRSITTSSFRVAFRPRAYRLSPASALGTTYSPNRSLRVSSDATAVRVSDAILKDHHELKQYYNEIINSSDLDNQKRFGNQFTWELARHSVGEELVVYPAFEKYLGAEGKAMAEHDREEHHKVKELLKEFQNMNPENGGYIEKLKELWAPLSQHIKEEEEFDMPALEKALADSDGTSESLANSFARTKAFAPTRSHPSAGEHPPFETVMGLLTAPIDQLADIFRKFPSKADLPKSSAK